MRAFESMDCQVTKIDHEIRVEIPSWDAGFFPVANPLGNYAHIFSDTLILNVHEDGEVHYRVEYWSWAQLALHCVITAMFSLHYWFGNSHWNMSQFVLITVFSNLLPLLICLNSIYLKRDQAFRLLENNL